ncbi:hypothetical protein GOP47_0015967, partial [Adiantum capillus-veneris]
TEGYTQLHPNIRGVQVPAKLINDQVKAETYVFMIKAGYNHSESLKSVHTPEVVHSLKDMDISLKKPDTGTSNQVKLGKVFTLSKKRKVEVEPIVKQLNFDDLSYPKTFKPTDAGMAEKMLL